MAGTTKAPAFQLYPKDFDTDENVREMTDEELGFYVRLLNHSWVNRGIPKDPERISRIMARPVSKVRSHFNGPVGRCWVPDPDDAARIRNPKQEEYRDGLTENSTEQSKRGKKGAESRWRNHGRNMAPAIDPPSSGHDLSIDQAMLGDGSASAICNLHPSPTPSDKPKTVWEEAGFLDYEDFEVWWLTVVRRHSNRRNPGLGKTRLQERINVYQFNRKEFEEWFEREHATNPDWRKESGRYQPNLFSVAEDGLWAIPLQPANEELPLPTAEDLMRRDREEQARGAR